jgi:hypothetical protein
MANNVLSLERLTQRRKGRKEDKFAELCALGGLV